ncbi:hypothetical protein Bbelb_066620 [Branchiostoma belcheri]|nr:hypothetical protein Bbelb_066620 [Branchiostoma belcheri]
MPRRDDSAAEGVFAVERKFRAPTGNPSMAKNSLGGKTVPPRHNSRRSPKTNATTRQNRLNQADQPDWADSLKTGHQRRPQPPKSTSLRLDSILKLHLCRGRFGEDDTLSRTQN